jgi:hypothetical protein
VRLYRAPGEAGLEPRSPVQGQNRHRPAITEKIIEIKKENRNFCFKRISQLLRRRRSTKERRRRLFLAACYYSPSVMDANSQTYVARRVAALRGTSMFRIDRNFDCGLNPRNQAVPNPDNFGQFRTGRVDTMWGQLCVSGSYVCGSR